MPTARVKSAQSGPGRKSATRRAGRLTAKRRAARTRKPAAVSMSREGGAVFPRILCPDDPKVSVIIPAMNEEKTIAQVIGQAARVHDSAEVIVVVNGSTDRTPDIAKEMGARVLWYPWPLGHDVGRAIGAAAARGDILLFTDGDLVIPAEDLKPLVKAVENGTDVALNRYLGPTDKMQAHNVIVAKHALNTALLRPDLKGASLTTIPHALSRRALEAIGIEALAVPPKAYAIALFRGLKVEAVHYIHVGHNKSRRKKLDGKDPLEWLILGDHLEALHWLTEQTDSRLKRTDLTRKRELVQ